MLNHRLRHPRFLKSSELKINQTKVFFIRTTCTSRRSFAAKRIAARRRLSWSCLTIRVRRTMIWRFTNRFAMLHPERVKAAAFGSPGGWALAPIPSWKGKSLRYPIGTADFEAVSGAKLDLERLKKVPLFLFMGSEDTNDSVVYRDSYD